jgi:toxin-antitoxin system PIN domain toxin
MSIADANVLLPILVEKHTSHAAAWKWWSDLEDDTVQLVPLVRLAVLRLLSSPVVMPDTPLLPEQALAAWNVLAEDPRCKPRPVSDLPEEALFQACVAGRSPSTGLWNDAWLAALALTLDEEFVTFDPGFRSFNGLKLTLLTA